jgi:hypothetical protein
MNGTITTERPACLVCGEPIPRRAYQAAWARTCTPPCVSKLAHEEHPELETAWGWRKHAAKMRATE